MLYFEPSQMKIVKALIKGIWTERIISDPKSRTIQKKKLGFQQFYLPFIYSLQIFYSSICWLPFLQTLIHWFLPLVKYGSKDDLNLFWVNSEFNQFLNQFLILFLEGEHALPFSIFSGVVQLLFGIWAIIALPIALVKRNEIIMMTNGLRFPFNSEKFTKCHKLISKSICSPAKTSKGLRLSDIRNFLLLKLVPRTVLSDELSLRNKSFKL